MDHKTTPKWAWPESRDPISKFWDPLITFEVPDAYIIYAYIIYAYKRNRIFAIAGCLVQVCLFRVNKCGSSIVYLSNTDDRHVVCLTTISDVLKIVIKN